MSAVEVQVRNALREVADEARPVPLGHRALAGVRRRRRRRARLLSAAAALLLAGVSLPRLIEANDPVGQPVPDLAGRNLMAAYHTSTDVRVLNPATGRYRTTSLYVETMAADLRFGAGTGTAGYAPTYPGRDPQLGVLDTRTGELKWLGMPHPIEEPAWSPDGRYVVARVVDSEPPRAVVVNPARDEATVISLSLPPERFLERLCWSDPERLLAVTTPRFGTADAAAGVQDLLVLDKAGYPVRTISIADGWDVACPARQGRVVVTRLAEQGRPASVVPPEAAIVDLATGKISDPVRLPWAGAIQPVAWRTASSFVAISRQQVLIVDLPGGTVAPVADVLRSPPEDALFLPTDDLDRHADELADAVF